MIHNINRVSKFRVREKAIQKNIQNPLASRGIRAKTGRMEDLGSDIAAEESPEWAVRGGVDAVLVAGEDFGQGRRRWAVGEERAVLVEGFVGNSAVGDEDGFARAYADGDDGAVFGDGVAEVRFHLERRFAEP